MLTGGVSACFPQRKPGFGAWLTAQRERLGWSQARLAVEVGGFYGKQAITKLENGTREPLLAQVARFNEFFVARGGEPYEGPAGTGNRKAERRTRFGRWLTYERERLGLAQREVAAQVGIALTYLNDLENGYREPSLEQIEAFSAFFFERGGECY
jgi:transcriptional regulator with XRE-family HTH domain